MEQKGLGKIILEIEDFLSLPILSASYRTVMELFEVGECRPSHLIRKIGASKSKMFNLLGELEAQELILLREDPLDSRCRLYSLRKNISDTLAEQLMYGARAHLNQITALQTTDQRYRPLSFELACLSSLKRFTPEFQIIDSIYAAGTLSAVTLFRNTDISNTTFFNRLRKLIKLKSLTSHKSPHDKRSVNYELSEPTRLFLEQAYKEIAKWVLQAHDPLTVSHDTNSHRIMTITSLLGSSQDDVTLLQGGVSVSQNAGLKLNLLNNSQQ